MKRRPPKSTLFPYPPLFRSQTCSMQKLTPASLTISAAQTFQAGAQSRGGGGSLQQRLTRLLDQPPLDRGTWNAFAQDDRGRVLFNRNGGRFSVPAANTKPFGSPAASGLLPAVHRPRRRG